MDKSNKVISQSELLMEYFKNNPNKNIPHPEIVAWALKEFLKRTGRVFADPDRGIRKLHQEGHLIKVKKGVYKYDPSMVIKRELEDFAPEIKERIFKEGKFKCAMCGLGKKEGLEIHIDHIKPKDLGGKATFENGQILCGPHNYLKKNFRQTETGKKMFINLYKLSMSLDNKPLSKFCAEILEVFEKNDVNGHIKWTK